MIEEYLQYVICQVFNQDRLYANVYKLILIFIRNLHEFAFYSVGDEAVKVPKAGERGGGQGGQNTWGPGWFGGPKS